MKDRFEQELAADAALFKMHEAARLISPEFGEVVRTAWLAGHVCGMLEGERRAIDKMREAFNAKS